MKEYGNRRSEDELAKLTIAANAAAYELEAQPNFKGTEEELKRMQAFERAYIDGYPVISDEEWDILKKRYDYKESLTAGSPSGRVWIKMQAPLPSIEKVDSIVGLEEFLERFPGSKFIVEPKFDGLTANLVYKRNEETGDYVFETITSRGNGRYGLQLNPYALAGVDLKGVPKIIERKYVEGMIGSAPDTFEIRGEALIHKPSYVAEHGLSDEEAKGTVWRSVVSGIFNRKLPMNLEGLVFALYHETLFDIFSIDNKKVWYCEDVANARLIASITPDPHRFLKTSKLYVKKDGSDGRYVIYIEHLDGSKFCWKPAEERVDIISYSFGYNGTDTDGDGVNLPLRYGCTIPGLILAGQVKLETGEPTPIYDETDDVGKIISIVSKFYGADREWKRDVSLPRLRNMHEYAMDGVVIKLSDTNGNAQALQVRNNRSNRNRLVVPKFPNDAIAVKLLSEVVRVKLDHIEMSKTTLNNVTCQGVLDKAYLTESGAMVSNVNLHNPYWLSQNDWIKEGQEYDMCMSLDIIPVLLPPKNQ